MDDRGEISIENLRKDDPEYAELVEKVHGMSAAEQYAILFVCQTFWSNNTKLDDVLHKLGNKKTKWPAAARLQGRQKIYLKLELVNKQKRITNELRTLIKAQDECSDDEIMDITKGSLLKASVELSLAVEELSMTLKRESQFINKYWRNSNNAILKLKDCINKKS